MTDRIIKILQSEKIDKYCIYEERRESAELFLVKKKADLMRQGYERCKAYAVPRV